MLHQLYYTRRVTILTNQLSPNSTTNSSGDEIANVNFLYDHIVHVQQNTIDRA